jgi:hypothetical protein
MEPMEMRGKERIDKQRAIHTAIVDMLCTPLNNPGKTAHEVMESLRSRFDPFEVKVCLAHMKSTKEIFWSNEATPDEERRWKMLQ